VLYLSPSSVPELWSVGLDGRAAHPWTSTGGNVVDFAAAPNGDFVVYSSRNELGGISLWRKDRSGGDVQLLLDCGEDHCSAPAIAPDSKQLAYARRQAGVAPGSSPAVGRIWLMELQTGETHPLSPDPNIAGYRPVWSPDGKWLSSYDELTNAQRVTNLQSGEEVVIPSEVDLPVEWTPDSSGLYYNNVVLGETVSYAVIFRFDLTSRRSEAAFGPENSLGDYNLPAISPAGDWLVVGLREVGGNPARQLWLMRLDGSERRQITSDPTVTVGAYRWSPDGTRVAFQTLEMGNSGARPKVMVWSKDGGEITLLVEDAAQPAWLP
jgi:TolB protein